MSAERVHIIQLLVRGQKGNGVAFLLLSHPEWGSRDQPEARYLVLPTRKTVADPLAPFVRGESVEDFVNAAMTDDLGLGDADFVIEQELEPAEATFPAVHSHVEKTFVIFPVDVWVGPEARDRACQALGGQWMTMDEALGHPCIAPSARAVFEGVQAREARLDERYANDTAAELRDESPHRLLRGVSDRPSMYGLARKWFDRNKTGVRHLKKAELDQILDTGNRAFNIRVADPYLRYQQQGQGFTWSFFTHKDCQDVHVHGAPVVEIYGILEGRMEIWSKPYFDRGSSAWSHRVLEAGDWLEVDALQCHIVHWLTEGKGVVFKAGSGPLAEVGRLGVKGKTPCDGCPCVKPPAVCRLAEELK